MEKNYNHENRHKYYLKCHLIFCIKYRRKILYGDFDNYIKTNFKSIAGKSDFNIDIMETDKDHIHFLISYPPKLSVTSMDRRLKQERHTHISMESISQPVEEIFLERENVMV